MLIIHAESIEISYDVLFLLCPQPKVTTDLTEKLQQAMLEYLAYNAQSESALLVSISLLVSVSLLVSI